MNDICQKAVNIWVCIYISGYQNCNWRYRSS